MKTLWNLSGLAWKHVLRHRLRTLLTLLGVAACMFLYTLVETMQQAVAEQTRMTASDRTLIVYRENRFCPFTSNLPEHYISRIERIDGVAAAVPVKVVVNNCNTSLDVVTFRGVPPPRLSAYVGDIRLIAGDETSWRKRSDAALIGETFARRRRLAVGDSFDAAGVKVQVAGILESNKAELNNVAFVHLDFLQQAARGGLGIVTQFTVTVDDPARLDAVAKAIDLEFKSDQDPTHTRPEKAFFAQTAKDLVNMVRFTRWVGLGAVLAVLALIANTILLVVRGRVRDNAVLQTLGFSGKYVGWIVLVEGMILGLVGGALGVLGAAAFFHWQQFTVGSEGLTLSLLPSQTVLLRGLLIALALGLAAGLVPAWQAVRKPIVQSLQMGG